MRVGVAVRSLVPMADVRFDANTVLVLKGLGVIAVISGVQLKPHDVPQLPPHVSNVAIYEPITKKTALATMRLKFWGGKLRL